MTIHALSVPCWVLRWDSLPLTGRNASHYETRAGAAGVVPAHGRLARHKNCGGTVRFGTDAWCPACDAEMIADDDWELLGVTPVQLPSPCWVAECDCGCSGDLLGEDEGYVLHLETEGDISAMAWKWGWQVTVTGLVYPDEDSLPPGAVLAVRPPVPGNAALSPLPGGA